MASPSQAHSLSFGDRQSSEEQYFSSPLMGGWRRDGDAQRPSPQQAPSSAWADAFTDIRAAVARRASSLALQPVATTALQRLAASGGVVSAAVSLSPQTLAADLLALASAFASAPHLPGAAALAAALDDLFSLGSAAAALPPAAVPALVAFLRAALDAAPSDTAAQPALRALVALLQARGGRSELPPKRGGDSLLTESCPLP